jgi:hypothetical protein
MMFPQRESEREGQLERERTARERKREQYKKEREINKRFIKRLIKYEILNSFAYEIINPLYFLFLRFFVCFKSADSEHVHATASKSAKNEKFELFVAIFIKLMP